LVIVLVCATMFVAGCASAGVPEVPAGPGGTSDPVLVAGRQTYIKRCANCHGNDGSGGRGTRLAQGAMLDRYGAIADQITVVRDGVRSMPGFAETLSEDEIVAVVRFTREVL